MDSEYNDEGTNVEDFVEPHMIAGVRDSSAIYKINNTKAYFIRAAFFYTIIFWYVVLEDIIYDITMKKAIMAAALYLGILAVIYCITYFIFNFGGYVIKFDLTSMIIQTVGGEEHFYFNNNPILCVKKDFHSTSRRSSLLRLARPNGYYTYTIVIIEQEKNVEIAYDHMGDRIFKDLVENLYYK